MFSNILVMEQWSRQEGAARRRRQLWMLTSLWTTSTSVKTRLVYFFVSCLLSVWDLSSVSMWSDLLFCLSRLFGLKVHRSFSIIFSLENWLLFWNASRRREKKTDWKGYSQNPNLSPQYASVRSWVVALTKSASASVLTNWSHENC